MKGAGRSLDFTNNYKIKKLKAPLYSAFLARPSSNDARARFLVLKKTISGVLQFSLRAKITKNSRLSPYKSLKYQKSRASVD
jgi:hypothetical protein